MKKLLMVLGGISLLTVGITRAQRGYNTRQEGGYVEPSVISIFSESGDLFTVALNGMKQNYNPQSSIRIEGITQTTNELELFFADNRTRPIRKTITVVNPIDDKAVNLVFRVVREMDGDARLRLVKMVPKEHDYQPGAGEYTMSYGQDPGQNGGNYNNGNGNYNNGNYSQPNGNGNGGVMITPVPAVATGPTAMDNTTFQSAKQTIANNSFDDSKLSSAKSILASNYVTTDQVVDLCSLFAFDESRLSFAKFAYSRTVDNSTYFKVANVFSFDHSKQELNDFISRGGH